VRPDKLTAPFGAGRPRWPSRSQPLQRAAYLKLPGGGVKQSRHKVQRHPLCQPADVPWPAAVNVRTQRRHSNPKPMCYPRGGTGARTTLAVPPGTVAVQVTASAARPVFSPYALATISTPPVGVI
jgi:hypothetical protein